jgi:hypothetical protein
MDPVDTITKGDLKKPKRKYKDLISSIQNNRKNKEDNKENNKEDKILMVWVVEIFKK